MFFNHILVRCLTLLFLTVLVFSTKPLYAADDDMVDPGQLTFREPMQMQNEDIDPFTGDLSLTYTDLELPGDGGLSVSIIRTHNSARLTSTMAKDSILGKGWNIHFGTLERNDKHVSIELQDGTQSTAVRTALSGSNYITKDFWTLYMQATGGTPVLKLSDGTKITFGRGGTLTDKRYYATKIERNTNEINITYIRNGSILKIG